MNMICCVADALGFCVKGEFIICELTFFNSDKDLHQSFKPDINWPELSSREYKKLQFTQDYVHGLDLHPRKDLPSSKTARATILEFYKSTYKAGKFVAVKNGQLERELAMLKIPYKRLIEAPKLETLDEANGDIKPWTCSQHLKIDVPTPRCTVRKCYRLWSWLNNIVEKCL